MTDDTRTVATQRCAIRGCGSTASWLSHNRHDRIDLCTRHRDLIEDKGLHLTEDDDEQ